MLRGQFAWRPLYGGQLSVFVVIASSAVIKQGFSNLSNNK